jgi:hypothetical protein
VLFCVRNNKNEYLRRTKLERIKGKENKAILHGPNKKETKTNIPFINRHGNELNPC